MKIFLKLTKSRQEKEGKETRNRKTGKKKERQNRDTANSAATHLFAGSSLPPFIPPFLFLLLRRSLVLSIVMRKRLCHFFLSSSHEPAIPKGRKKGEVKSVRWIYLHLFTPSRQRMAKRGSSFAFLVLR
mmetsp:Transcript_13847/g.27585  ORF Transcript_13847/g.27585 Transcript_13847/m.27585 type:complete len:129 (+) Transcript_13847:1224-1610(+)